MGVTNKRLYRPIILANPVASVCAARSGVAAEEGSRPCMLAGSRDHEEVDAQVFAGWGVDFLKYDNCWAPASDWVIDRYTAMSKALNKTERPIVYSMCDWGVGNPWLWAPKVPDPCASCRSACVLLHVSLEEGLWYLAPRNGSHTVQ